MATVPELAGKRLLVLGAGHYQIPLIVRAKAYGCYVLTADYLPDNPGHRLADLALDVSTADEEAVLEAARLHRVDGVVTYGSDVSAPTVTYVAEALGLPGNPLPAGRLLQRKDRVRALQQELGLPHPRFAAATSAGELAAAVDQAGLRTPLIVKPADSSGSKGQSVIAGASDLAAAFEHARPFSRCGVVLAEEFLEPDLPELVGDVLIQRGRLAFGQYGHNYFHDLNPVRVPIGEVVPGFFGEDVAKALDRQLEELIGATRLRTGCLNFDALRVGGRVHLLDIGLRNGGNYFDDLIELSTGIDLTRAAIYAALGLDFPCPARRAEDARPAASYILNAAADGRFRGVSVAAELRPYLRREVLFVQPGEQVAAYSRGDHALGVLLLLFPDVDTLRATLPGLPDLVRVLVD